MSEDCPSKLTDIRGEDNIPSNMEDEMKHKVIKNFRWKEVNYKIGDPIEVNKEQEERFLNAKLIKKGVPKKAKDKMIRGGVNK